MTSSSILIRKLEQHSVYAKRKYLLRFVINALSWLFISAAIVGVVLQSWLVAGVSFVVGLLITLYGCLKSQSYQKITLENLLLHLNRVFDELEESAELVIKPVGTLNLLQTLQLSKIEPILSGLLDDNSIELTPEYSVKKGLVSAATVFTLLSFIGLSYYQNWLDWPSLIDRENLSTLDAEEGENTSVSSSAPPSITQIDVQIKPPAYTQQDNVNTDDLNLNVLSGSTVSWRLGFSDSARDYQLHFGRDKTLQLLKGHDGLYQATEVISRTGIYSIKTSDRSMESLYSITVVPDNKPYIRFITPKKTITEIAKNAAPSITLEVLIGDDFGVSKVDILASIAKGSGEAVKFRDEVFTFDGPRTSDKDTIYVKTWHLTELGMEPGDEFYFSVRVWDNKAPTTQMTQSQTKIIRWLEDDQEGILSDGIVIDFIPEYFKSQRQIIIETQELIASEDQLSRDEFKKTSQSLGQAQSDLKQKYGQFLGDEFGEGGADVVSAEDNFEEHDEEHEHENEEDEHDDHEGQPSSEHDHEEGAPEEIDDLSGYEQVIAQYGHAHGEVDIGLITKQNPKAMMKRAIAAMWQAELHLRLSEPELALPFENEALSFLNKAKKAERIYVKRLGFEPPPVTEQRRYQGKLDDIKNRRSLSIDNFDHTARNNVTQLLGVIDSHRVIQYTNDITDEEQILLREITQLVLGKTASEPELIRHVATLEKLQLNQNFDLNDCNHCLLELEKILWEFIPDDEAIPTSSNRKVMPTEMENHYLELLGNPDSESKGTNND